MKKVLVLMLGTVLAVACGKTELPVVTDSSANGAEVNAQAIRISPAICTFLPALLDMSFGNCGRVYVETTTFINDIAAQPDGKMLLAGNDSNVFRLNPNGSFDTSFSDDGKVTLADYGGDRILQAIQVLPDGKILVAGNYTGGYLTPRWFVMRLNSDGSRDTGFYSGSTNINYFGSVKSIAVQPDGTIFAISSLVGSGKGSVSRFNADGSYDYDFQSDNIFDGLSGEALDSKAAKIFVHSSGRIVAIYNTKDGPTATAFDTNGHVDPWFGNSGSVAPWKPVFRPGGYSNKCFVNGAIKQGDDKIILAGGCNGQFAMARINADGSLDSSFGVAGKVSDSSVPTMYAVALRLDGRIVVAGSQNYDFLLVGYNTNGSKDLSWGNGQVVTGFPKRNGLTPVDHAGELTVTADGSIVAAGSSFTSYQFFTGNGFALARYRP